MKGIESALSAGLRVKINTVALKGFNEDELESLIEWCAGNDLDITFIEVMPMGDIGNENRIGQYWSIRDVRKRIARNWTVVDTAERTGGPARYAAWSKPVRRSGLSRRSATTSARAATVSG